MPKSKTPTSIDSFITTLNESFNNVIAVSVVDIESGMTLGHHSNVPSFNPELASAFNVDVVKAKTKAIEALKLNQKIDDIMITLEDQYHLIKVSPNYQYMTYIALKKEGTNLALVRNGVNNAFKSLAL